MTELFHHLSGKERQDLFALHYDLRVLDPAQERVNVPGLQNEENWTYRMKPSIETLIAYDRFNDYLAEFIEQRRNKTLGASARA